MLTAWKVEVIQLREDELNWRDYVFTYRYNHEFESESGFQRELQIEFNKNNGSKLFLLDRDSISHSKLNSPNKEIDYLKILQNPFWDTFCTRAIQSGQDANLNSIVLKKRITTILELLNKKDD